MRKSELRQIIKEEVDKVWDELFGELAWKYKPTEGGDMYLDADKVFNELSQKFVLQRKQTNEHKKSIKR